MKIKELNKKLGASITLLLFTMLGISSINEGYFFKFQTNTAQEIKTLSNKYNTDITADPAYFLFSTGHYALNCNGHSVVIDKDSTSGETLAYRDDNSDGIKDLDVNGNPLVISNDVVDGANTVTVNKITGGSVYGFATSETSGNYGTSGTKTLLTYIDGSLSTIAGCYCSAGTTATSSFDNDFSVNIKGGSISNILSPGYLCNFNGSYSITISGNPTITPSVFGYYMNHAGTLTATSSSVINISGSPKIGSVTRGVNVGQFDSKKININGDITSDAVIYCNYSGSDISGINSLATNTGSYTINKTSFRICNCSAYACSVNYDSATSTYYFEYKEGIPESTFDATSNTINNLIGGGNYEITFSDSTTKTIPTLALDATSYSLSQTDAGKKITQIVKKGLTSAEAATAPTYSTDTSVTNQITYNFTSLKQGILYKAVFQDVTDPIYFSADDGTTTHSIVRGSTLTANQRNLTSASTLAKADSDPQSVTFNVLPKQTISGVTFDESEATFSGLVVGETYDIKKGVETFASFKATATSMDVSNLVSSDPFAFDGLVLEGDNLNTINSDSFSITGTIYPREATPTSTYDVYNQGIKDLVASAGYNLIDSMNTSLGTTSDATGFILLKRDFWGDSIITKVVKQGISGKTIDSLPQTVSYSLLPQESVNGITFTTNDASLNGLTSGKKYSLDYGLPDPITFTATGTTFDLSVYLGGSLVGHNVVSIVCLGDYVSTVDSDSLSLSGLIKVKQATPVTTFNKSSGDISGLSANMPYTFKDAKGNIYSVTSNANGIINFFNSEFEKETIIGISAVETDQYQASSFESGIAYSIMSYESITGVAYDQHNDLLTGLESGTYSLTFSDGSSIDISGTGTFDLLGYSDGSLLNKTLSSIYKHGSTYSYDSDTLNLSGKVLPREKTPTVNYDVLTGIFSGLLASKAYSLVTEEGTTLIVLSDVNGEINMSTNEALLDKTIISFISIGNLVTTCDSLNGVASSIAMIKKADLIKKTEEDANDLINKKIEDALKDIIDKDTIDKLKQEAIDEINNLDKNQSVDDINKQIDKIVKKLDEMIVFVHTKQVVTINLEDMKKGCTDDKLNLIIDDGKYKVSQYDPHTSSIDDLLKAVEETKEKLQVERQANRSKEEVNELTDDFLKNDNYRGLDDSITLLKNRYQSLIDSSTSVEEAKLYVEEYQAAVEELLIDNPIELRCANHFYTLSFDILYIVFFIVYVFILKRRMLDPFNFGATCLMGILSTIMTLLINCSICVIFVSISWGLFVLGLSYILTYYFIKKKKDKASL